MTRLGRIVASSNYQISIVLPAEVQNVGINASKQAALVPTVDKSDGRVMYLDVLQPGGYATLNVRLVSQGEPLILKLTVELSHTTSGVLAYTITSGPQRPAARTQQPPASTASVPRISAAPKPPALVRTAPAATASKPVTLPGPQPAFAPVSGLPLPAVRSPLAIPSIRQQDSLQVTVAAAPEQGTDDRTFTYQVRDLLGNGNLVYILSPKVTLRGTREPSSISTMPNNYQRITASGVEGTFKIKKSAFPTKGGSIIVFEIRPVDTRLQQPLPKRYVAVMVRL